jgi:hypothetical protein
MSILLQIIMALAAGSILLALVSGGYADGLLRAFEAALDAAEYRLALRARGRAAAAREESPAREGVYAPQVRLTY